MMLLWSVFFFQAEDGVRVGRVTGVQTCALPIFVGEGWVEEFGGVFRAHEVYDPKTNSWAKLPRMLTPRHGFATATVGRRIYAVSGVNNAGGAGTLSVVAVNEVFEP